MEGLTDVPSVIIVRTVRWSRVEVLQPVNHSPNSDRPVSLPSAGRLLCALTFGAFGRIIDILQDLVASTATPWGLWGRLPSPGGGFQSRRASALGPAGP